MKAVFHIIALMLLATGCAMPKSTIGLDRVMKEQGLKHAASYKYRCTRGAHRGSSEKFKENTLAALLSAEQDSRYAFIEFDIQYSKDGQIVVFHDKTMLRTFGSLKNIGKTNYADLLKATKGEIATYGQAMNVTSKKLNIEIKSQGDDEEDEHLVDEVIADLKQRRRLNDIVISSISSHAIIYINDRYPRVPTGQIFWLKSSTYFHFDRLTEGLYQDIIESKADYIMLHAANLRNIHDLITLKPSDKTIVFWDFNDTMYVVHKDLFSDHIWGDSGLASFLRTTRYTIYRWLWLDTRK